MADLDRFVEAQDKVLPAIRRELAGGRKESHWMWFVFPQIAGLGSSPTARFYALSSLEEARAYHAHPILGPRLAEMADLVLRHSGRTARDIFGTPDDMKYRSCMTLFAQAAPQDLRFAAALRAFHGGQPDTMTLELLRSKTVGGDRS